jgi:hypothetical protein
MSVSSLHLPVLQQYRHPDGTRALTFHFCIYSLLQPIPIRRSQYLLQPRQAASLWFQLGLKTPAQHFGENSVHRYAPTSPSAFNHKKKPLLPGCDRSPSRSLARARGAQQQPSPPHSGRGHSTAHTHRHFPLTSLVQDCSDVPLAPAQAPNPTCHRTCLLGQQHRAPNNPTTNSTQLISQRLGSPPCVVCFVFRVCCVCCVLLLFSVLFVACCGAVALCHLP